MGSVEEHEYHVDVVRSKLTRNLAVTFNEILDELVNSLDASIPLRGDGAWHIRCQKGDFLNSVERRLGQSSHYKNGSTCNLRDLESCVCRDSAVYVNFSNPSV